MSNTYTKGYSDGNALTEAMLDNAYQTLQLDIANAALTTTGSTSGQVMTSNGSGIAPSFQTIPDPQGPFALRNYGLKATVATGVMTISLKTKALTNPSATDIVDFNYSTNGTTSASYTSVQVTAATTLAINSSANLGFASTATCRIYVYGYYNTVTTSVKLAVATRDDLDNGAGVAMTAISASADSGNILYATAALTVVPRLLGWIDSAHSSAGAWQTPTKVNINNNNGTGRWLTWTPTLTTAAGDGTGITSSTLTLCKYRIIDGLCYYTINAGIKFTATGRLFIGFSAPITPAVDPTSTQTAAGGGVVSGASMSSSKGLSSNLSVPFSNKVISAIRTDGTSFSSSSGVYTILISGNYEI